MKRFSILLFCAGLQPKSAEQTFGFKMGADHKLKYAGDHVLPAAVSWAKIISTNALPSMFRWKKST